MRFKLWGLAAIKDEVLPSALAFWTRHVPIFFDDVPFPVANHADHFAFPTLQAPRQQQAQGNVFLILVISADSAVYFAPEDVLL
jgi:hypothetical protein